MGSVIFIFFTIELYKKYQNFKKYIYSYQI